MTERQRREFIRVAGVAGLAGIAGCNGLFGDSSNDSPSGSADSSGETPTSELESEELRSELSSTVTTAWEQLAPVVTAFEQFQPPITGENRDAVRQMNDQLEQVSDSISRANDLANRIEANEDTTPSPETEMTLNEYQDVSDAFVTTAEATVAVWGMEWIGLWLTGVESRWRRFSTRPFPDFSQDTFAETFVDRAAGEYAGIVRLPTDQFVEVTADIASQTHPGNDAPTPGEAAPGVTVEWDRLRSALEYVEDNATRLTALVTAMIDLYRLLVGIVDIDTGGVSSREQINTFREQVEETRRKLGQVTAAVANAAEQTDTTGFDVEPEAYPAALETLRTGLEAYQTDLDRWAEEAEYRDRLERPLLGAGNRIFAEAEFYVRTPAGLLVERGLIPRGTVVLSGDPDQFARNIRAELEAVEWGEEVVPRGGRRSVSLTTQVQNVPDGIQQAVFDPSVVEITTGTEVQLHVPEVPRELFAGIAEEFDVEELPTAYRLNGEPFEEPPLSTSVTYDWPQLDTVVARAIWPADVRDEMPPQFGRFQFAIAGVVVDGPGMDWEIEF